MVLLADAPLDAEIALDPHAHPYAGTGHTHDTTHNHDAAYSGTAHTHLPPVHNHDTSYSATDHTHAGGGGTVSESLAAMWDQSALKTNIGAAFVDVYTQVGADGKSAQIDTNGKTQVRLMVLWNKIGTGTQTVQVLEVGTANVLATVTVVSGRNVSALVSIPAFAQNSVKFYKLQAKSTVAADDPVFEGARVYLR